MKRLLPVLVVLLVIGKTLVASSHPSMSGPSSIVAQANSDDPKRAQLIMDFYTRLLGHPEMLGFHPDGDMVSEVMERIRTTFVDPVSDEQMEAGIRHQVRYLLQVAKVPADPLDGLPLDSDLPSKIMELYGTKVNRDVLGWAEMQGAFEPTGDPHSALLPPSLAQSMTNTLDETAFAGIGTHIETDRQTSQVVVLDVMDDTPAARAGVQTGDIITRVDGLPTGGMSVELVSNLLRGAVGTSVALTVSRAGVVHEIPMVRAAIRPRTVTSKLLPGNIGYLRLSSFSVNSGTEVQAVLLQWKMARVPAYIIDLRNNGGGYVLAAMEICSLFVPEGRPVMWVKGREGVGEALKSRGPGDYSMVPIVLLVNGYTASASEVTAGCLRDYQVATLVGSKTYGKGSMQKPEPFAQKTLLKITIARWYTPSGRGIDRVGMQPDFEVQMPPASIGRPEDAQLQKALEIVHTKLGWREAPLTQQNDRIACKR